MRVAVFSDIHGNPLALDAVLDDIEANGGVDAYWVLGDLTAIGYDPAGVIERVNALPNVSVIRGNCDRYITSGTRPKPTPDQVQADLNHLPVFTEVTASFAWTQGFVAGRGWLDWLAALPLDCRFKLPDGTQVLLVHASPGHDDDPGLHIAQRDDEMAQLLKNCEADLVFVGHTHWPFERHVNGVHVFNAGSVSNPFPPDLRASYVLLEADASGFQVNFRRAAYDHQAVIEAVRRVHPAGDYIIAFQEGRIQAGWLKKWYADHPGTEPPLPVTQK